MDISKSYYDSVMRDFQTYGQGRPDSAGNASVAWAKQTKSQIFRKNEFQSARNRLKYSLV